MEIQDIIKHLFKSGLGELYVLHAYHDRPVLGKLIYEKDQLVIKDSKHLAEIKIAQLQPCIKEGAVGMITKVSGHKWESITFYGLGQCDLPVDLSNTQHGKLKAAENQYGDNLVDFVGSVYRAYQLMLDNHFLPVVLLKKMLNKSGVQGLMVSDLRRAPMSIALINAIHNDVSQSVDKHLTINIDEELSMGNDEFASMFKDYL